jgi:hypothetical protein
MRDFGLYTSVIPIGCRVIFSGCLRLNPPHSSTDMFATDLRSFRPPE